MLKGIITLRDRKTLMIGLSFKNLDKFYAEPMDTFIKINGKDMGLDIDVMIFSGRTEAELGKMVEDHIGPNTIIHIDPKLKS